MPPVLLLDVMDTLVREPFFEDVPAHFGMSVRELLAAKDPTAWIEFEEDAIDEEEFLRRFFRDRRPVDGEALRACLRAGYRWLDGAEALLAELAGAGLALHALSNYPTWYRALDAKLGLSRYLAWSFVSCRTGVRKPDPRAFTGAAASLGVPLADCLFVDDRPENVEAALSLGLPAILATDIPSVRRALVARGVLAEP